MDVLWHTPVNHRLVPFMNYSPTLCTCSTASSVRHCPLDTPSSSSSMAKLLSPIDMLMESRYSVFYIMALPKVTEKKACVITLREFCNAGKLSGNVEILTFWSVSHYLYIFASCYWPSCFLRNLFCNPILSLVINCHYRAFASSLISLSIIHLLL